MHTKRAPADLSIRVPAHATVRDNGPKTAVPSTRSRPPSDGMKSARPNFVSTPHNERNPIFSPPLPSFDGFLPPPPMTAGLPGTEKRGMFNKLFKRKQSVSKGHAIV
jgi:hypothetical protein